MNDNKIKIREFLGKHIQNHELDDGVDIFASGFVNSLFAMQLVLFMEGEFGIELGNEDLDRDNFRSINALSNLLERKTA